jgi:hypothetical protein
VDIASIQGYGSINHRSIARGVMAGAVCVNNSKTSMPTPTYLPMKILTSPKKFNYLLLTGDKHGIMF